MDNVIRHLRQVAARTGLGAPTDAELLDRFVSGQEEDAFTILVRRHGPMVLGVCLRVLHHKQDAEDAFQATFLTLVRKGHGIRERGALASWLYRVAFRAALRLKGSTGKHNAEPLTEVPVEADPVADAAWRELRPVLDTEVQRLPQKYRAPIVLCYLEGKTYEEAADTLGCPKGTVAIRLLRGKLLLKNRLARRGFALSAGLLASQAALPKALAAVGPSLAAATATSAAALVSGAALTANASATVAALTHELGRALWVKKACMAAAVLLSFGTVGAGVGGYAWSRSAPDRTVPTSRAVAANVPTVSPRTDAETATNVVEAAKSRPALEPKPAPPPVVAAAPASKSNDRKQNTVVVVALNANCLAPGWLEDVGKIRLHARHAGQCETWIYVMPSRSAKCARSGLAFRENLDDEAIPTSPNPRAATPAPTLAAKGKCGSVFVRIYILAEKRIIVVTPA
jgi:RNA polymerase sigma factor (sigma-70 family)